MLRDPAGLAGRHLGAPDVVEERGLAVIDVPHDRDHRRTRRHLERGIGLALQVVLDDVVLADDGGVAHFLDHQDGRVLLDHLIDRGHHSHVHQRLDDLGGLDGHLLREFADCDRLGNGHLAHDARRRHLEAVLGVGVAAHRAPAAVARLFLLVSGTHVADDVQLLAAITGGLVLHHFAGRLARLGRGGRLPLALGLLPRGLLRRAPRLIFGGLLADLLVGAPPAFLLEPLAVQALLLQALALGALDRGLGLLLRFAQLVQLFLLQARLILEDLALDVGALAAHLDIHRSGAALRARELEFGLRLAAQRDLARRRVGLGVVAPVAAAQVREQLVLGILADHVIRAADPDPGLIELLKKPVDRHLQHLGELRDGYICHAAAPKPWLLPRTSACGRP